MPRTQFYPNSQNKLDARFVNVSGDIMTGDLTVLDLIMSGGDIYPSADSTTAIQINKADGTTNILNVDTTNGRVGIGTTSPDYKLEVVGTLGLGVGAGSGGRVELYGGAIWPILERNASTGGLIIDTNAGITAGQALLSVKENGTERFTILDNGNVGIGTTGPDGKLEIVKGTGQAGNADTDATLVLRNTVNDYERWGFRLDAAGDLHFDTTYSGSDYTRMSFSRAGNVGIGTTGPTAKLDVNSDIIRIRTTKTPASAGAAGNTGDFCWDSGYVYMCVATNTWKRAALSTW